MQKSSYEVINDMWNRSQGFQEKGYWFNNNDVSTGVDGPNPCMPCKRLTL